MQPSVQVSAGEQSTSVLNPFFIFFPDRQWYKFYFIGLLINLECLRMLITQY